MKKILPILCLTLLLVSCGGGAGKGPSPVTATPEEAAQILLDSGAFSETLEVLDPDIAAMLYGLEETPVTAWAAYLSTGATAEECTFLTVETEEEAKVALDAFRRRVEEQTAALESYQPAEISKLEAATYGYVSHETGFLVYLVVAADANVAQDAVVEVFS